MGIGRKGYFIKFKLFFSPKGEEFDLKKFKCHTYAVPLPPLSLRPNIDTCINKLACVASVCFGSVSDETKTAG